MKHFIYIVVIAISFIGFSSCEDVVDVPLPTEEPRLIIDAIVRVDTSETFTLVSVKVTETNSFFESTPPANLQQITLTNLDTPPSGPNPPTLIEIVPGSGIYEKSFPTEELIKDRFVLQIDFEDKIFVAESKFVPTVEIDELVQGPGNLFGEDDTEVIVTYTDSPDRDDFYLFDFDFANFLVTEDEFYQGQQFSFSYFYEESENINPGDSLEISILGVDESFFNYMDKVIEQSEGGFGPFQTPAITVRGNIINATEIDNIDTPDNTGDPNNFALGYFAIVQEFKKSIVIE